jgi:hypothetical protein
MGLVLKRLLDEAGISFVSQPRAGESLLREERSGCGLGPGARLTR